MILDYIQIMRHDFFNALENVFPPIAVGKTPYEVVDEDRHLNFKLLRYVKGKDNKRILLIVPHIINRPYILDLNDDVSVIRMFIEHGFPVYMIDWAFPQWNKEKSPSQIIYNIWTGRLILYVKRGKLKEFRLWDIALGA